MKAEAKEKPIRELLQDISHTMHSSDDRRGVICPKLLNRICFFTCLAALLFVAATLIAMIWEAMDPALGLKDIASACVILVALLTFRSVNEAFVN